MRENFGKTPAGEEITLYSVENDRFMMKVMDYGAVLVSFIDKDTGIDIVKGYDSGDLYIEDAGSYLCAIVGRTANRIRNASFTLNGVKYDLPVNNGTNCHHGGLKGFSRVFWNLEEKDNQIICHRISPDGEEGYPGNMDVTVIYTLDEKGIQVDFEAVTDKDCPFAPTSHAYFNMNGDSDGLNQELKIYSDRFSPLDEDSVSLPQFESVEGRPFDFREFKKPSLDINSDDEQIKAGYGFDHFYPVEGEGIRKMCELRGKKLVMTLSSDMPGFHFYTANYMDCEKGRNGYPNSKHSCIALEAEYLPNAVNVPEYPYSVILKAGEKAHHVIRYDLRKRD